MLCFYFYRILDIAEKLIMSLKLALLLFFTAGFASGTTTQDPKTRFWVCYGDKAAYTNGECDAWCTKAQKVYDGCYYLNDLQKYRSCGQICNNKIKGSEDEEECRTHCPDYYRKQCRVKRDLPTTPPLTIPNSKNVLTTGQIMGIVVSLIALLAMIGMGINSSIKQHKSLKNYECVPTASNEVEAADGNIFSDEESLVHQSEPSTSTASRN
ncbi:hypothetical protein EB796_017125 [Bugula neritina]|uniref:Uncharacterized protein n=1 Tax=Bugula neritina TaxID=10212 RepID=A0A7J7JEL5_BUGNE|nr:hypothetical protein EB796_017125 [Bugula neritina]